MGYYLGDAWPTKYTTVHVTFEGQNQDASHSKELNKVKEVRELYDRFVYKCFSYFSFHVKSLPGQHTGKQGPETQVGS